MSGPLQIKNCAIHSKCSKNWYEFKTTNEDSVRLCLECEKYIYIASNLQDYKKAIDEGRCVTFFDSNPPVILF